MNKRLIEQRVTEIVYSWLKAGPKWLFGFSIGVIISFGIVVAYLVAPVKLSLALFQGVKSIVADPLDSSIDDNLKSELLKLKEQHLMADNELERYRGLFDAYQRSKALLRGDERISAGGGVVSAIERALRKGGVEVGALQTVRDPQTGFESGDKDNQGAYYEFDISGGYDEILDFVRALSEDSSSSLWVVNLTLSVEGWSYPGVALKGVVGVQHGLD